MKLQNLFIFSLIFLFPTIHYGAYQGKDALQATKILSQTTNGEKYHPLLEVQAHDNSQGKADVYKDEYGVCVLVANQKLNKLIQEVNILAYPDKKNRPEITPHITIIQGVFKANSLEKLKEVIKQVALDFKATEIIMENHFIKGGGGNTFLDVAKGNDFFNKLTEALTKQAPPDGPMKQVIDDIKSGDADLTEMREGGAWRDFNIPGSNRPHITAVYGKQDKWIIEEANKLLTKEELKILIDNILLVKIDQNGNVYGKPVLEVSLSS